MDRRILLTATGSGNLTINTIIGNVAASITSKTLLASKLGITEADIRVFQIDGNDVKANIRRGYSLPAGAFMNDKNITKFIDLGGRVLTFGGFSHHFSDSTIQEAYFPAANKISSKLFYNCTALTSVYIPKAVNGADRMFYNTRVPVLKLDSLESINFQQATFRAMTVTTLINAIKLKTIASPSVHDDMFTALKTGCEIRVNIALSTANSGNPHAALVWVKNNRSAVVKFYDDNGNYVSTL